MPLERPTKHLTSAQIRAKLKHPIVDVDGHCREFGPAFADYIARVGGADFAKRYREQAAEQRGTDLTGWANRSWEERRDRRIRRGAWWGGPTRNTLDAATAVLPQLLYERMDELGIDLTVLYGSLALRLPLEPEEETRRVLVRAMNTLMADAYRDYAGRIVPVAGIPMHTPREAIDELEHAVKVLGHKVIVIPPGVPRPIPALHRKSPEAFPDACWMDHYALDSEHDYDPVWAKFQELGVAVTVHTGVLPHVPWYGRSISNNSFNHIGNHAYGLGLLCKALFIGGVTRRFPGLNFAFLEGGVGWACIMLAELVSTWEKRNLEALEDTCPANLDTAKFLELHARYGGTLMKGRLEQVERRLRRETSIGDVEPRDEWAALAVKRREDLRDLFVDNFYFGCEADDPINAWAFNTRVNSTSPSPLRGRSKKGGARLNAVLGSDIGHYDVPDMARVVEEAYELVDKGLITDRDFEDLVFGNPVRLHGRMNPAFFKGTPVEEAARRLLGTSP